MAEVGDKVLVFTDGTGKYWLEESSTPEIGDKGLIVNKDNTNFFLTESPLEVNDKCIVFEIKDKLLTRGVGGKKLVLLDDSYISSYTPDQNYGSETILESSPWWDDYRGRTPVFRFNISRLIGMDISTNLNLSLYFHSTLGNPSCLGRVYTMPPSGWNEDTITWNNRPLTTHWLPPGYSFSMGWHDFEFTWGQIKDYVENRVVAFRTMNGQGSATIRSKEYLGDYGARLTIVT